MKKFLLLFVLAFSFMHCSNTASENSEVQSAHQATPQQASQNPGKAAAKKEAPEISTRPVTQKQQQGTSFSIVPESITAKAGSTTCVSITGVDFNNIMSMQYSMSWDKDKLQYKGVQDYNLPYLGKPNFGAHKAAEGLLTFLWVNNALQGTTITNGTALYKVCFDVVGKSGQTATLQITDKPTIIEALDGNEKVIQLQAGKGTVTIE